MSLFNARQVIGNRRDAFGVHNPFENPTVPLSSIAFDEIFGATSKSDSGESVTADSAMGIPTFFRCVALLSTVIASVPLKVFKKPDKEEVNNNLLDEGNPNLLYTYYELMELIVTHLAMWGNAYIKKVRAKDVPKGDPGYAPRGSRGEDVIVDLRPIAPSRVNVKLDDDGNKIFEVIRLTKNGTVDNTKGPIIYTSFEIMHIPGMGYDGLVGLSIIESAVRTLGTSIAADRLAARYLGQGSNLGGIIKVKAPLANQTQADEVRRRWLSKHAGVQNAGDVVVLDAETDYEPLTIRPDNLQFLESRGWQTREVARMFGIPPHLVGDVEKSTSWGTGIEQQQVGFVTYTLNGWFNRIEQRFTREIIVARKQYAKFDTTALMRGAMSERFAAYSQALQWGWLTRNEIRLREDLPKVSGQTMDEYMVPMNMMAAKNLDKNVPSPPTAQSAQSTPKPTTPPGSPDNKGTGNGPDTSQPSNND